MAEIKINENYRIKAGQDNVTLYFEKVQDTVNAKTGNPIKTTWQTYHTNVGQALTWLMHNELKEAESLKEIVEKIQATEQMILKRFSFTTQDLKEFQL